MASFINDGPYLATDRANNLTLPDLQVCPLCNGLLWVPISCKSCEKSYCLHCIKTWHRETGDSTRCPTDNCLAFVQGQCHPAILHVLSTLQITCRYRSNGCEETLPYNNLQTHEEACGYRLMTCSGCEKKIVKKDFQEHERICPLVSLKCSECSSVYKRQEQIEHTDIKCIRIQVHQLRVQMQEKEQEHNDKMNLLENQVNDLNGIIQQLSP